MSPEPYVKIFRSMLTSSVWVNTTPQFKVVWITILDLKDEHGNVEIGVPGLAKMAEVSLEECQAALDVLCAPDPWSGSKESEGRRLVPIERGWNVVNHHFYTQRSSKADRTKKQTEAQRIRREEDRKNGRRSTALTVARVREKKADAK